MAAKRIEIGGKVVWVKFLVRAFDMNGYEVSNREGATEVMVYDNGQIRAPFADRLGLTDQQAISAVLQFREMEKQEYREWLAARPELAEYAVA
jgi:(p)ppGpp synthase/HD superfamily hydrolase